MKWERITELLPVEDEHGARPFVDKDRGPRPTEEVPREDMPFEVAVNEDASGRDRRILRAALNNLSAGKPSSVAAAMDFESTARNLIDLFIKGVRVGDAESIGKESVRQFADGLEYEETVHVLGWLSRRFELSPEKKTDWKSRFGLDT